MLQRWEVLQTQPVCSALLIGLQGCAQQTSVVQWVQVQGLQATAEGQDGSAATAASGFVAQLREALSGIGAEQNCTDM